MANHAKVCTGKTLDALEINDIIIKLNQEKLAGVFDVSFNVEEYYWSVSYKDDGFLAIEFWLSDEDEWGSEVDGKWIEYEEPKILSKNSCIEFRHGHSFQFLWWFEGVFRENLGRIYNARMWDDGIGWCNSPAEPEKYETFETYVRTLADVLPKSTVQELYEYKFPEYQREGIPAEVIEKLKLNFLDENKI